MEKPQENVTSAAEHDEKEDGAGAAIVLFFILGLVASLVIGWIFFPPLVYSTKRQPVDFNHVKHMELVSDGCESCHFFRPDGTYSGVPQLAQCIQCHEEPNGEDPEEVKFVEEFVKKGREVPWLVYSRQPACVFFSHAAHVKMAQMDCVICHGHIGESENLRPYQENRISGYSRDIWGKNPLGLRRNSWDRMKMDVCAECHAGAHVNPGSVQTQKDGCFVCHK
ncbi:MAG TPA: menaquinone reductase multiheme cytochrome c subunit QrcA [Desulfobacterales bacterium]|nr:menaquinone reductase multiheme cytochrome c subunit QrcA [Desulfobacterales bacterium]